MGGDSRLKNDGSMTRGSRTERYRRFIVAEWRHVLAENSSISIRRTASCNGRIAKGCESCARTSGSQIETLSRGRRRDDRSEQTEWCVELQSISRGGTDLLDTKKAPNNAGVGRILEPGIDVPKGETAGNRSGRRGFLPQVFPSRADLEIDFEMDL